MATFKSRYTISELLKVLERRSLIHYFWSKENGEYTFYFVDKRRDYFIAKGMISVVGHRSNYFRLRNKIRFLPFRLSLDPRSKSNPFDIYLYTIVPDSVFLNEGSAEKLDYLNEQFDGKQIVNVVVI